jgi:multiple sugar transport system permease protein
LAVTTISVPRAHARTRHERPRGQSAGGSLVYWVLGVVFSAIFLVPLLLAVFRSLQQAPEVVSAPSAQSFDGLSFQSYIDIFQQLPFFQFLLNSLIVSAGGAIGAAVLATLAGYGLARFRFRGQGLVFGALPFQALLTPIYLEFNAVGLTDNQLGLVLFYITFNLPFGVFVMRNTFAAVPRELEEAAYMDGDSVLGALWHVMRPMALPGIATTLLFTFLTCWTEFLGAFTFLTSEDKQTLPVGLLNLVQGSYGQVNFAYLVAGSVVSMVPCLVLYLALQRYYVQGLASGALKS